MTTHRHAQAERRCEKAFEKGKEAAADEATAAARAASAAALARARKRSRETEAENASMKGKLRKANAVIDDDARLRKEYADTQNELEIALEQLAEVEKTTLAAVSATPSLKAVG